MCSGSSEETNHQCSQLQGHHDHKGWHHTSSPHQGKEYSRGEQRHPWNRSILSGPCGCVDCETWTLVHSKLYFCMWFILSCFSYITILTLYTIGTMGIQVLVDSIINKSWCAHFKSLGFTSRNRKKIGMFFLLYIYTYNYQERRCQYLSERVTCVEGECLVFTSCFRCKLVHKYFTRYFSAWYRRHCNF